MKRIKRSVLLMESKYFKSNIGLLLLVILSLLLIYPNDILYAQGSIGGCKFNDSNVNGVKDEGEETLANWTIYIDENDNGVYDAVGDEGGEGETSVQTDPGGNYIFQGLEAGTYKIAEVMQSGWFQTSPEEGFHTVTIMASESHIGIDFGNFNNADLNTISGYKFNDLNANGAWDPEEMPLADWEIYIDEDGSGTFDQGEPRAVTDIDGYYIFEDLLPGTYTIAEVIQTGWFQTFPAEGIYTIEVAEGEEKINNNFGNANLIKISGYKFEDADNNGEWDDGEVGMGGWLIYLDLNLSGEFEALEDIYTWTDPDGYYEFLLTESGNYRIAEVLKDCWEQTMPSPNPAYFGNYQLGDVVEDLDFGNHQADLPPLANNVTTTRLEKEKVTITLDASDQRPIGGAIIYIIDSLPFGGTLSYENGKLIDHVPFELPEGINQVDYTPYGDEDDPFEYQGSDYFEYSATDGGEAPCAGKSNIASVTLEGEKTVIFVSETADGTGNGLYGWDNAFKYLQDALAYQRSLIDPQKVVEVEIWIKEGTYYPDEDLHNPHGTGEREASFFIFYEDKLSIYGGYPNNSEKWPDRDADNNETIFSGDLFNNDGADFTSRGDNSFHVVIVYQTSDITIDGVTISGGNASAANNYNGSGLYCIESPINLNNCTFFDNLASEYGGGLYCTSSINLISITNCTFIGNKSLLDGGGSYCTGANIVFEDCIYMGNLAENNGGGLYIEGNQPVELTECTILNNYADWNGGGIFCNDTSLTLEECTLVENTAEYKGGGIYSLFMDNLEINSCGFTSNEANDDGGGMCNWGGTVTLEKCTFTSNIAADDGGAIINRNNSDVTIGSCTFAGNSADSGGGINNFGSSPEIVNSIFVLNTAGMSGGGGIYNKFGSSNIINCVFYKNTAQAGGTGTGGLYNETGDTAAISNCILWANSDGTGTGSSAQVNGDSITVEYCCVQDDDPNDSVAYIGNGNIDKDPTFIDPDGPDNILGTLDDNFGLAYDSPCIDAGDKLAVPIEIEVDFYGNMRFFDDVTTPNTGNGIPPIDIGAYEYVLEISISSNYYKTIQSAVDSAGENDIIVLSPAVYSGPGNRDIDFKGKSITLRSDDPTDPNTVTATIVDCDGTAEEMHRGFILNKDEGADSIIDGITIINGYSDNGGAIYCQGTGPTIRNCVLSGNTAEAKGGALYIESGDAAIEDCTISSNNAAYGGGVSCDTSNSVFSDCTINSNTASSMGGSIYSIQSSLDFYNCTMKYNTADNGGAMYNEQSDCELWGSILSTNAAAVNGGGVYNLASDIKFDVSCKLRNNTAIDLGGGIYNSAGDITAKDCKIKKNNSGSKGGGIYSSEGTLELTSCELVNNRSFRGGAILNCDENELVIIRTDIKENYADMGGGIHNSSILKLEIWNSKFLGNTSNTYGGGVYNLSSNSSFVNCIFVGNTTVLSELGAGGGIYNWSGCQSALHNCSFAVNSSENGSSIAFDSNQNSPVPSNAVISNSILWEDEKTIFNNDGSVIEVLYSNILGGWPGDGVIDEDPLFPQDPNNYFDGWIDDPETIFDESSNNDYGDLRLNPGSPCIDAGANYSVPQDIFDIDDDGITSELCPRDLDDKMRFIDDPLTDDTGFAIPNYPNIIDMGAYEAGIEPPSNNLGDFTDFATEWMKSDCDINNNWCNGADMDQNGSVNLGDLILFVEDWLVK